MGVTTREPIRLYDGAAPGSEHWDDDRERAYHSEVFATDVVTNVAVPTLTPVLPDDGCGTAVIVAPGGGFHALSIESEGFGVARWLAEHGVAAFVLKYRLVPSGDDAVAELAAKMAAGVGIDDPEIVAVARLAADDAAAAVRAVRARADELAVAPDRVGVIGFSAGGNVAVRVADVPDGASRPDFVAAIYASLAGHAPGDPPAGSGPMFVVAATDDPLGLAADAIGLYERWRGAGLPAEIHLYDRGGHGFGVRVQHLPSDTWIDRLGDWLTVNQLM